MAVLKGTLTDSAGAPISGASVHVYLQNTTTPAALYSDFEMTVGTTNPLTSEADGAYLCYIADGHYDLVFEKTAVVFDASDSVDEMAFDGVAFKAQKGAASGLASLNSSSKVVENPANATVTPTADKIPIADGLGKLDGWVTPSYQALMWKFQGGAAAGNTSYHSLYGSANFQTTEIYAATVMPVAGSVDKLYAKFFTNTLNVAAVLTLFKNGSSTGLTVSIPAGSTGVITDLAHSVSFVAGDTASWQLSIAAGSGTGNYLSLAAVWHNLE